MFPSRVRVAVTALDALEASEWFGIAGSWCFDAKVRVGPAGSETRLGSPDEAFEVYEGTHLVFDDGWRTECDLRAADLTLEVTFRARDDDLFFDDDLGEVRALINLPMRQDYRITLQSSAAYFSVTFEITVLDSPALVPGPISTVLATSDADAYNSIEVGTADKFVHINPVVPVPWTTGVPPIPDPISRLPASPQVSLNAPFGTTALNAMVNPALIPVLPTTHPQFAERAARIRITQYWPWDGSGANGLDLSKLIWRTRSDRVRLWNGTAGVTEIRGGQEVMAYGTGSGEADEEVVIEVRFDEPAEPLLGRFRAWVGRPRQIPWRAVIVRTTRRGGLNPRVSAADIDAHIRFTNVILWQAGIELVPDPDTSTGAGTRHVRDAIFEFSSAQDYTFSQNTDTTPAPIINAREGVFNLAFIHSDAAGRLLGAATDRALSEAETFVTLEGTPSTSWVRPTGVWPDDPAAAVRMRTFGPSSRRADLDDGTLSQAEYDTMRALTADGRVDRVCGCLITDSYVTSRNRDGSQRYFRTLAHELGHVIGLHHRGSGWSDSPPSSNDRVDHQAGPNAGRGHPWDNNFMTYGPHPDSQDLDMIQCMHVRTHPLLTDAPPPPVPPPPPPAPKPVPAEYHPTEADRVLLQEYLTHRRPGLSRGPYAIGSSGPDGDGVDGVVGPLTRGGIRQFQSDVGGLDVDGIYGPLTRGALDRELNGDGS